MTSSPGAVRSRPSVATIILAGGSGRRLGGVDKAAIRIDGEALLDRALALAGLPAVVVGPPRPLPAGVLAARESPAGSGPAAAVATGVAALAKAGSLRELVLVLAVDQAGVDEVTLDRLIRAATVRDVRGVPGGAVLVEGGRRHLGVCCVSGAVLRCVAAGADWTDRSLRSLLDPLLASEVPAEHGRARDIDNMDDLHHFGARLPAEPERNESGGTT